MNLSAEVITKRDAPKPPEDYERNIIADKFAVLIAEAILRNKDCLIKESTSTLLEIKRYSIHVFTPIELEKLAENIARQIRMKLPIIL